MRKHWVYGVLAVELTAVLVFAVLYDSLDFRIYMLGGHAIEGGSRLYLEQLSHHWYTNTPFMAALFIPLSAVPLTIARVAWQLASVAAFAWACASSMRLAGYRTTRRTVAIAVVAGMVLEPMWHSIFLGQVNMFLMALVMADIWRVSQRRPAGIGIGIAAAIKITPAIFVVLLLVTGRIKAAVTASVTFAVCSLAAFAIAPDASRLYWRHTFYDTSRVGVTYISNQSPFGAAARIMKGVDNVGGWYQAIPLTVAVLGLALAVSWARRNDWLAAAAVTGVTGLLVSPISWAHHWVWVAPALLVLLRDGSRVIAGCGYVLFVLSPLWWTPHGGAPLQYGFHGPLTMVANCYLVAGACFLAHMALRLRDEPGAAAPEPLPEPESRRPALL
ncbi:MULTISPECIES: glycosyltransferase 87 family protein [Actinomadura]|uniref:glycosyltransferase 87 family protein n=1 Tax=Actinomadura TaxID=1988 RepID=UPI00156500F7|nr:MULTISPECIES: glycosyltransferase 87 family protein [Actinomadura]MBT2208848.1 DUF2029 domain-containing protein [Actinomadura sp. NEAU-AAG7]